ncbi:hypothetical protein [Sulfitobacter sp. JB4-11]|uniref:hypothetical protein n=1 Tax=Sulfitobacter rhodophyticola TaxID=3238304 RepID=UPI003511B5F8
MRLLFLSALVFAFGVQVQTATAAQGYLYDCDMQYVKQGRGWVSPKIALVFPGDGTVKVVDSVTLHFNEGPLLGTIVRENATRMVVKWSVENAKAENGTSFNNFDYRASIAKRTGAIELTAIPRHYDSGLRSPGTCRKRTQ